MLYSQGFRQAETLASKIVPFFKSVFSFCSVLMGQFCDALYACIQLTTSAVIKTSAVVHGTLRV